MRAGKFLRLLALLSLFALLTGCVPQAQGADRCTVLFEDSPALFFYRQDYEVVRGEDLTVSVGVPRGQRVAGVNYDRISLSGCTGSSESYDYYTLTLHQVRYPVVIRLTAAPAFTTVYHGDAGEVLTVTETSPHLRFNTLPYRGQFSRAGWYPAGWTTAPDGAGERVGFGSRIDHQDVQTLDLYAAYLPCTPEDALRWRVEDGAAIITGWDGTGDLVLPGTLGGLPVTAIDPGAFGDVRAAVAAFPASMTRIAPGAFRSLQVEELYLFDALVDVSDASFGDYAIGTLRLSAVRDPVYSGSYFETLANKADRLRALQDEAKLVLFCGSSARFGYDSALLEAAFPAFKVVNMGVYAYANMLPQARILAQFLRPGDIVLSSPELDAVDCQFCARTTLDKETFCMAEADYGLLALLDLREFTGVFDDFAAYQRARAAMPARSYDDTAALYDEDGVRQTTPSYNSYGDYILPRPNNEQKRSFGVKRACYAPACITQADWDALSGVYETFTAKGATVYYAFSPRSAISVTPESTPEAVAALDAAVRARLGVPVLSTAAASLMDPLYFFGTDNHLSTEGAHLHTLQVISDLRRVREGSS